MDDWGLKVCGWSVVMVLIEDVGRMVDSHENVGFIWNSWNFW